MTLAWGSAEHHALTVEEINIPKRNRRMCLCGCRKKVTHNVKANGIALSEGCELQAWRNRRKLSALTRGY